jgi:hypothetical protein
VPRLKFESVPPLPYHCLSDPTKATIDKCHSTFGSQLSRSREFVGQLEQKVGRVYAMQQLRNELKGVRERRVLENLRSEKEEAEQSIARVKEGCKRNFLGIIEENSRLEELSSQYDDTLSKEQTVLQQLNAQVQQLTSQNNAVRWKVKSYLKMMGNCEGCFPLPPSNRIPESAKESEETLITEAATPKNKPTKTSSTHHSYSNCPSIHSRIRQMQLLLTESASLSNSHSPSVSTHQRELLSRDSPDNLLPRNNPSLKVYESGIRQIELLEQSIIKAKGRTMECAKKTAVNEEQSRKDRITLRVKEIEFKKEVMKLFVVYLKGREQLKDKVGLRLPPIISYFEKVVRRKEEVLEVVAQMSANLKL